MLINSFKAGFIFFVQAIENEGGELIITKRLANRSKGVCQSFCFVEIGGDSEVALSKVIQLSTNSHGACRGLGGKIILQSDPDIPRCGSK
jgi:hypothetical protein